MTERTRVNLCADLLRTIFNENRELLLELQLRDSLGQYEKAYPVLSELKIGADLSVDAVTMPDNDNSVVAISHIIRKTQGFMEIFVGAEESEKRIHEAVMKFRQENALDVENFGLANVLQEFLKIERQETVLDFDNATDMEKARALFLDIFNQYLVDDPDGQKGLRLVSELTGCGTLSQIKEDGSWFEFAEAAVFPSVVEQLSTVVENLEIPLETIERIFGEYGKMAEDLGIVNTIFQGALSGETKFGVEAIDILLRYGLERDATMLLEGPAVVEKIVLSCLFLKRGLDEGGCAVVVSTLCSPERLRKGLSSAGVDVQAVEGEGRLIIVDWYTRHMRQITGIEENGSIIRVSNDLTNLAVGIDIALRKASGWPTKRLILDMVSPTIMVEGFDRVNDFLSSLKAKLKNSKTTGLITLNPGMHTREDIDIMKDIFDGAITITRTVKDGQARGELYVSSYSGGPFDSSRIYLDINERGMAISDTADKFEEDRIAFDHNDQKFTLGFPGIENMTAGGLPIGQSFLIWISSKMTTAEIIKPLIMETIAQNYGLVLALSTVSSDEVIKWLTEMDYQPSSLIARGALEIIDWQAQKDTRILGVEEHNGVLRVSKDITHLGVGIDLALRKIGEDKSSVAVMETHSPAFRIFDIKAVYPFAQTINARLGRKGFTSFVVMERGAHDSKINAGIEEVFDGVLDVMDAGDHLELAVLNLKHAHFLPEYRQLQRLRSGFSVDVSRKATEAVVLPGTEDLNARIERLNRELALAIEEKSDLEKRTKEFVERESDWQRKHDELRKHLVQLETKLAEQQKGMMLVAAVGKAEDGKHRDEVARILAVLDNLLEHLPEDMIEQFANSDEFDLYERIMDIYLKEDEGAAPPPAEEMEVVPLPVDKAKAEPLPVKETDTRAEGADDTPPPPPDEESPVDEAGEQSQSKEAAEEDTSSEETDNGHPSSEHSEDERPSVNGTEDERPSTDDSEDERPPNGGMEDEQ